MSIFSSFINWLRGTKEEEEQKNPNKNIQLITLYSDIPDFNKEVLPSTNISQRAKTFYQALKKLDLAEYEKQCDEFIESQEKEEGWILTERHTAEFEVSNFQTASQIWKQLWIELPPVLNDILFNYLEKWVNLVVNEKTEQHNLLFVCDDTSEVQRQLLFFFYMKIENNVKSIVMNKLGYDYRIVKLDPNRKQMMMSN